ncbi:hypothetical protein GQX74_011802 [Glossina fuscipes]|nr:hypothetical protein GQX74_011802 [Glossina fuscipes]
MVMVWKAFSSLYAQCITALLRKPEEASLKMHNVKALIEFSVILLFFLPLYQNMLPNSCGPCNILHVKLMSLPLFTYKSVGPIILAFSSGLQEKSKNEGKFNNEHFLQETGTAINSSTLPRISYADAAR